MMGIKVDADKVTQRLEGLAKQYGNRAAKVVEVGVTDASIAEYAQYVEFGWAQRVTPKQSLFLSGAIGRPVPLSNRGRPDFSKAAIKPGTALVNPPRPFLRGTLVAEQEKWKGVLKKALRGLQDPASALTVLGTVAAQDVQATIASGGTTKEKFQERARSRWSFTPRSLQGVRLGEKTTRRKPAPPRRSRWFCQGRCFTQSPLRSNEYELHG